MASPTDRPARRPSSSYSTRRKSFRPRSLSTKSRTMSSHTLSDDEDESHLHDEEEEWDEVIDGEYEGEGQGRRREKRGKKDEPMSPAAVVFYVIALYLVFQILTRSDESEILSHLPSTSSLRRLHHSSGGSGSNERHDLPPYHLPYNFPQLPNPIPSPPLSPEASNSIWRTIVSVFIYPFYLIITILAVPLPLLVNLLYILKSVAQVLLYPLTAFAKSIFGTFVAGPWRLVSGVLQVFYPLYVFAGGVVGVGCVIGVTAGWVGRVILDWLVKDRSSKRRNRKSKSRTKAAPSSVGNQRYVTPSAKLSEPSLSPLRTSSTRQLVPVSTTASARSYNSRPSRLRSDESYRSTSTHDIDNDDDNGSKHIYTPLKDVVIVHEPISLFDEHELDQSSAAKMKMDTKRNDRERWKDRERWRNVESSDEELEREWARATGRAGSVKALRQRGVRESLR